MDSDRTVKRYTLKQPTAPKELRIDYARELNQQQLEVVQHGEGPALVLAGAGSGKTRTLVYRVAWLVEHGIQPDQILLVTFTNKAALEMTNRVEGLLKGGAKGLWSGTFHSMGNRVLRQYAGTIGYPTSFTILDAGDSVSLLKGILGELSIDTKKTYFPKADVIGDIIGYAASSQQPLSAVLQKRFPKIPERHRTRIVEIAKRYTEKKHAAGVMDFDDLLVLWLQLLEDHPKVTKALATRFRYILVDEYQDTNTIQASLVERLASVHHNLLVVGDDAQSIYSFRAANVGNILEFPKRFPQAKTFKLETNYRSTPEILAVANTTISHNPEQFRKVLKPVRESGSKPALVLCKDSYQQASFIVQRVTEMTQEDGRSLTDLAVLLRSTFQSIELELELNKAGIPYVVRGGLRFFEQAHVKDVIAYLRVRANPRDELSWLRVLTLQEGIGPASATNLWRRMQGMDTLKAILDGLPTDGVTARAAKGWDVVAKTLRAILDVHDGDIPSMIRSVLTGGYEQYLTVSFDNPEDRREDLEQLANFAVNYDTLERFLADVTLSESFRGEAGRATPASDDVLVVSTIHQAKGLEWPVIFLIGITEGGLPHYRSQTDARELAEERRLFYVAVTRAAEELYLSYPIISSSFRTGSNVNHPSQFLTELDDDIVERWELNQAGSVEEGEIAIDEEGDVISRIRGM